MEEQEYYSQIEEADSPPLTQNGYLPKERKIIAVVCVIFLLLLALFRGAQVGSFLFRDRELTLTNYKDYLQIRVVTPTAMVTNPQDYDIVVTAKKTISSAELDLNVLYRYDLLDTEESSREVRITIEGLPKGESYTYSIHFEKIAFCRTAQVVAITGRLP